MREPTSIRDALVSEALSDLQTLLDQVETLPPLLAQGSEALNQAHAKLATQLANFIMDTNALAEGAKVKAVQHIIARTEHAARLSVEAQAQAMNKAAQEAFRAEVTPAVQRLVVPLGQVMQHMQHPWERWLVHAATAVLSSGLTLLATVHLWWR